MAKSGHVIFGEVEPQVSLDIHSLGRIDQSRWRRLCQDGVDSGLFLSQNEFLAFSYGVLVSRRVSYRRHDMKYNESLHLLEEIDNLCDQLMELKDDSPGPRDERKRQVDTDEAGDVAVYGVESPAQEGGAEATPGLHPLKGIIDWLRG